MIRLTLRIPAEMHEQLRRAADEEKRSLNAEILWLLGAALSARSRSTEEHS